MTLGDLSAVIDLVVMIVSRGFLAAGVFFVLVGAVGMVRFPDFYTRMHAAGMTDTLGAEFILFALILEAGWSLDALKLALIALFLFLTSPTSTHAVANAAYTAGVKPMLGRFKPGPPGADAEEDQ